MQLLFQRRQQLRCTSRCPPPMVPRGAFWVLSQTRNPVPFSKFQILKEVSFFKFFLFLYCDIFLCFNCITRILTTSADEDMASTHPFGAHGDQHLMQVGISVEPTQALQQLTTVAGSEASEAPKYEEFCRKMLENFYNYASSFMTTPSQITSNFNSSENYVPVSTLHSWYSTFVRRFNSNPQFWK